MRIRIAHETVYRYETPAKSVPTDERRHVHPLEFGRLGIEEAQGAAADRRSLSVDDEEGAAPAGYLLGIRRRIVAGMRLQLPKEPPRGHFTEIRERLRLFQSFILYQRILRLTTRALSRVPVFGASAACVC